jgi:hypothetical protein
MGGDAMTGPDLATSALADLVGFDFRAPGRDRIADALAVQARAVAFLAGIADPEWERPLTPSAVEGAPDWTLRDHVGHLADWNDEVCDYIQPLVDGSGGWPADDAYNSDFDAWNEGRRDLYAAKTAAQLREWYSSSATRLLALIRRLPPDVAASDDAWDWAWAEVNGHPVQHLAPAEVL